MLWYVSFKEVLEKQGKKGVHFFVRWKVKETEEMKKSVNFPKI